MKSTLTSFALGLGLAAGFASVGLAGGSYNDIGIKTWRDAPAAVPVPAPVPVPTTPSGWYLRADIGVGFADSPKITQNGRLFGFDAGSVGSTGPEPFGANPAWFNSDFNTFVSGGIGAGYNWGRGFRTDLTAEARTVGKADGIGGYRYNQYAFQGGPPATWQPVLDGSGNQVVINGAYNDHTEVDTKVFLFNAYYDVAHWGPFKPYIGAGIGFTYSRVSRDSTLVETNSSTGVATTTTNNQNRDTFGLAAAATAGVSYDLTQSISLDVNYRYLYLQGSTIDLPYTGGTSRVSLGDYGEHALRTGLRFNID